MLSCNYKSLSNFHGTSFIKMSRNFNNYSHTQNNNNNHKNKKKLKDHKQQGFGKYLASRAFKLVKLKVLSPSANIKNEKL